MATAPSRASRLLTVAATIAATVVLGALLLFAVDNLVTGDAIRRNVEVAGRPVGGLDHDALAVAVSDMATRYEETPVRIATPAADLESTAGGVGLTVDEERTVDAIHGLEDDLAWWARPGGWLRAQFTTAHVEMAFTTNDRFGPAVAELVERNEVEAREPALTATDGVVTTTPGESGHELPAEEIRVTLIAEATRAQREPVTVEVAPSPRTPRFTDAEAQELAAEANARTAEPLTVTIDDHRRDLAPAAMRQWFTLSTRDDMLELEVDHEHVHAHLRERFGDLDEEPVQLTWDVEDGRPTYTEGRDGARCCAEDSAARIVDTLDAGDDEVAIDLEVIPPDHDAEWAESLGITEPVAVSTTEHACCAPRVVNIQRMADMVRGAVIEPGERFSLNGHVGPRTRAKGFVADAVIYDGRLTEDVGGGVSQFATTMFNAAFFSGLEIPEYQMHTLYISRYPYGREATLSHPHPDLVIHNNTPYGVLIWPSYTDTSITVTFYSTRHIEAEQTAQSESPAGNCTQVRTVRTRTWLEDDRTEDDAFYARYQPADGVQC